ncbi:hypothetical protein Hs30E_03990 [Lactococcus hodotermopsidis]|uniref:Uncharacterized protein n=1 Tax=Pseudolactococcus hodotermopsidis TaxID=2709157 RepID=A0A6A0BBQ3_9LACT|nr:hypothetical protein [Lactococcus hodotermopsidis]GFH41848.1 hypothetical protein Hs30E_03990 [Lactococcus hodotermopsidis]
MKINKQQLIKSLLIFMTTLLVSVLSLYVQAESSIFNEQSNTLAEFFAPNNESGVYLPDNNRLFEQKTTDGCNLQYQSLDKAVSTWWNVKGTLCQVTVVRFDGQNEITRKTLPLSPDGNVKILFKDLYANESKFPRSSRIVVYISELNGQAFDPEASTLKEIAFTREDWQYLQKNLFARTGKSSSAKMVTLLITGFEISVLIMMVGAALIFVKKRNKTRLKLEIEKQVKANFSERREVILMTID